MNQHDKWADAGAGQGRKDAREIFAAVEKYGEDRAYNAHSDRMTRRISNMKSAGLSTNGSALGRPRIKPPLIPSCWSLRTLWDRSEKEHLQSLRCRSVLEVEDKRGATPVVALWNQSGFRREVVRLHWGKVRSCILTLAKQGRFDS